MQSTDEFEFLLGPPKDGYVNAYWGIVTDTKIEQGYFNNSALPTAAAAGTSVKQFKDIAGRDFTSYLCYLDEFTRSSGALAATSKSSAACPASVPVISNAAGYRFPTSDTNAISIGNQSSF